MSTENWILVKPNLLSFTNCKNISIIVKKKFQKLYYSYINYLPNYTH